MMPVVITLTYTYYILEITTIYIILRHSHGLVRVDGSEGNFPARHDNCQFVYAKSILTHLT